MREEDWGNGSGEDWVVDESNDSNFATAVTTSAMEDVSTIESNVRPLFQGQALMSEAPLDTANLSAAVRESVSDFSAARSLSNRHKFPSQGGAQGHGGGRGGGTGVDGKEDPP